MSSPELLPAEEFGHALPSVRSPRVDRASPGLGKARLGRPKLLGRAAPPGWAVARPCGEFANFARPRLVCPRRGPGGPVASPESDRVADSPEVGHLVSISTT
jgi:hypothetical protein